MLFLANLQDPECANMFVDYQILPDAPRASSRHFHKGTRLKSKYGTSELFLSPHTHRAIELRSPGRYKQHRMLRASENSCQAKMNRGDAETHEANEGSDTNKDIRAQQTTHFHISLYTQIPIKLPSMSCHKHC